MAEKAKSAKEQEREQKLFVKLTTWLGDSERSTSEVRYREESAEDLEFYAGRQDTQEVLDELEDLKRPDSTFNECKPKIDMLVGIAAQMNLDGAVVPVGKEDEPLAELMQNTLLHYKRKLNLLKREMNAFKHSTKAGRSYLYYHIDGSNPFKPEIKIKIFRGYDCYKDPDSVIYDMSDARFFFINQWFTDEDIKARFKGFDSEASKSIDLTNAGHFQDDGSAPKFFNESNDKHRLVECWYKELKEVFYFTNPVTGKPEFLVPEKFKDFEKALFAGVTIEGQEFKIEQPIPKQKSFKEFTMYCIFGGSGILESGQSPYWFEGFPVVQFGAYLDENENRFISAINQMKSPQIGINTMARQLNHLLQTSPKGILMHEAGAVLNLDEYEERGSDPTFHLELISGGLSKVKFSNQPQISPVYGELYKLYQQSIKDASGIQNDMLGIQSFSREPGISMQMRQDSSIAVLYILFANFTESRTNATKMLMRLMQQYVTTAEVIRIDGAKGAQLLEINTQMNPQVEGFNDISAVEFDFIVDEELASKSARMSTAKALMDFNQTNPGSIPPALIMEYLNMPFSAKQQVIEYTNAMMAREDEKFKIEMATKVAGKVNKPVEGK